MAGFEITSKKQNLTGRNDVIQLAAVFGVLTATMYAYLSVFEIGVSLIHVFFMSGIAVLLSMLVLWNQKYRKITVPVFLVILVIIGAVCWDKLCAGIVPYVNSYVGCINQFYKLDLSLMEIEESIDLTSVRLIMLLLEILLSLSLLSLVKNRRGKLFMIIVILLPVVAAAVVGRLPSTIACWLLLAAVILYLIACHKKEKHLPLKEIIGAAIMLGILFFSSQLILPRILDYKEQNYETYSSIKDTLINEVQIDIKEFIPDMTMIDVDFHSGDAPDGELAKLTSFHHTGEEITEIILVEKPEEPVYMREYIGAFYDGKCWTEPDSPNYDPEIYMQQYPELEELTALCAALDSGSAESLSDEINQLFGNGYQYTQNPGRMPEDRDFAEGFLFEKKEGFCVHFATAATLIYRICGVPARYVEGYMIRPEQFIYQSDGQYKAVVTDENAHAWCETYTGDYDWEVREHTFSYGMDESEIPEAETAAPPDEPEETPEQNEDMESTENEDSEDLSTENAVGGIGDQEGTNQNEETIRLIKRIALSLGSMTGGLFLCWLLIVLQQKIRRRKRYGTFKKKKGNRGIINIYKAIYGLCVFAASEPKECKEQEKIAWMAKSYPQLSEEEWNWIYDCAERATFSGKQMDKEEYKEMYRFYQKLRKSILQELTGVQKLWFLYGKAM